MVTVWFSLRGDSGGASATTTATTSWGVSWGVITTGLSTGGWALVFLVMGPLGWLGLGLLSAELLVGVDHISPTLDELGGNLRE